ncbi:protease [Sphingobacterium olei]|uniref:Protease n=1 Tax=Sphingobacterium olei TaxID=2571155 RepID=A0A4U0NAD3_9SPHI|nr:protease [Sphingobacterium olei]TJZ50623.1 protease [Sphingobacterium olei]
MNKLSFFAPAILLAIASSCNTSQRNTGSTATDSITTVNEPTDTSLTAKLSIPATISLDHPIEMTFTVYNPTDSVMKFCKWHTPFEPLMSKYLDIVSDTDGEVNYLGPMAKRIMPPPANSYLSISPSDSILAKVDLKKGYDLTKPGTYTIKYNSDGISRLIVHDSVIFTIN